MRGYLICSIERTGSSLLAQALFNTGLAGEPYEYFNPVLQQTSWMRGILQGCSLIDGLPKIIDRGTTPNQIFGAKLHWLHAKHLTNSLAGNPLPLDLEDYLRALSSVLPSWMWDSTDFSKTYILLRTFVPDLRVIWMRRSNAVARAISFYRALHSGVWHRERGDMHVGCDDLQFDYQQIDKLCLLGALQNDSWARVFDELGVVPHGVLYEDLAENYETTVRGVLSFLEIAAPRIPPPELDPQADTTSYEWEIRYRLTKRRLKEMTR
jgi:LPS sulfotransferase NodH